MDNISFEDALKKLENYVNTLEKGELTLDESIDVYARATELSSYCLKKIDDAKLRISKTGAGNER